MAAGRIFNKHYGGVFCFVQERRFYRGKQFHLFHNKTNTSNFADELLLRVCVCIILMFLHGSNLKNGNERIEIAKDYAILIENKYLRLWKSIKYLTLYFLSHKIKSCLLELRIVASGANSCP